MMTRNSSRLIHVAKVDNLRYDCQFVSTNDEFVWKDTPDRSAVNAVYRNKEKIAETIPYSYVQHIEWTSVRVEPGFVARIKNTDKDKRGETPSEAVSYLDFNKTYTIDRPPITSADSIEEQIVDILRTLPGAVHIQTIPRYLNYDKFDKNYESQEILTILKSMDDYSVYQTRSGDRWWSTRK